MKANSFSIHKFFVFVIVYIYVNQSIAAQNIEISNPTTSLAIASGKLLYRQGIADNGKSIRAIVAGDVSITGKNFSCQNCHGRSGLGTIEGNYIVPAIAGNVLFSPQVDRKEYSVSDLANALRNGVTPSGRKLDSLMPRFAISDLDISNLAEYLNQLSSTSSPGTTSQKIRFATIFTEQVPIEKRQAMLNIVKKYFDEKNAQTRLEGKRPNRGIVPEQRLPTLYRKWELVVWTLKGAQESWQEQLDKYYNAQPVFAVLGGRSSTTLEGIDQFCEERTLPCLFIGSDFPNTNDEQFYTLNFSRGMALEADNIEQHLRQNPVARVIQIYCDQKSSIIANYLASNLSRNGIAHDEVKIECDGTQLPKHLERAVGSEKNVAVIFWLPKKVILEITDDLVVDRSYFSSTLFEQSFQLPKALHSAETFFSHIYRLPGKPDSARLRFKVWARTRGINIEYPLLQAQMFFACITANDTLNHSKRYLVRDYLLDGLDHSQGLQLYLPFYPRPVFSPGQRFLSKGGYILPIKNNKPDGKSAQWYLP